MSNFGPTRLVLIRSGRFDYADVDLLKTIQFVGDNNVGKTSLAATFQFLYVDDTDLMHFAYPIDETCKYYFPDDYCWMLFECITSSGPIVVGARGLGALQQHRFKRFAYRGNFVQDDYLDERNQPRSASEVFARLQDREVITLEPAQLRAALTGSSEAGVAALRLIPLRQRSDYPH